MTDPNQRASAEHTEVTDRHRFRRRILLSGAGVLTAALTAGCVGDGGTGAQDDDNGDTTTTADDTGESTDTTTETANETTETDSSEDDTTDDEGEDDDETGDASTVSFDLGWQERIDFQQQISGQNFGAAVTTDGVFFGAEWGFAALDLEDGSRMWETTEWEGFVDIHADSDGVVAYTNSFDIVSLDPSNGTERWRTSTTGSEGAYFNTALTSAYFVAESADGVGVYDRDSGDVVGEVDASPRGIIASDDALVVLGSGGTVVYDVPGGSERWRADLIMGGAVIDDGRLVGIELGVGPDATNRFTAVDIASGDQIWRVEVGESSIGRSPIARADGVGVFISDPMGEENTVYAHDLGDGSQLWTTDVGDVRRPFAVADSGVVIAPAVTEENRAKLRAYDAESGDRLDQTDGGLSVTEAAAIDRLFLEIELNSVTALEF